MDHRQRGGSKEPSVNVTGYFRDKFNKYYHDPIPSSIGLQNARACVDACFDQFVDKLYSETHGDFEDVCNKLSHAEPNTELWELYCCDSTFCGVWTGEIGQSPSVDLIINKCQNIGDYLIYDPGPPPPNAFTCSSATSQQGPGGAGLSTTLTSGGPTVMATILSSSSPAAAATSLNSEVNSTAPGTGKAPSVPTGLTEGSKAAIGICSSLAIIVIIFLVGFLISRRRSRPKNTSDSALNTSHRGRSSSEPPSGLRTPLITPPPTTPSKGAPLTPPARLSDRRLLPSLLKPIGTPNSSLASGMDERTFSPTTPRTPTEKNLSMQHEGRVTPSKVTISPASPPPPAPVHFAPYFLRDSGSSYSSGPGGRASTTTIGSNKANPVYPGTPTVPVPNAHSPSLPTSPTRPSRLHGRPVENPHLATPAGPPPNRALPAPPPYHPASPTFTVSPVSSPGSPKLPAVRPLALTSDSNHVVHNARPGVDKKGHTVVSAGVAFSSSAKDLTNTSPSSHAREPSESWGSWAGTGGGVKGLGAGVMGGRKGGHGSNRRSRDNTGGYEIGGGGSSVSLQELSPRKLGG